MIRHSAHLDKRDVDAFKTILAFLRNRLAEQGTIDWALSLKPWQRIERLAVQDLLTGPGARVLAEPWASAWRLVEESWSKLQLEEPDWFGPIGIQNRLQDGDRSGALVASIVELVAPRLGVEALETWRWNYIKKPPKPKRVEQILSANLTSGDLADLTMLGLPALNDNDIAFLKSLANALEVAVKNGLNIAARLGWDDQKQPGKLGSLGRVYYVTNAPGADEDGDPDAYRGGIAPSVKLLHAVVARIAEIQPDAAQSFIIRWQLEASSVFVRLWSAMARSSKLVTADHVASFLTSVDDRKFWDIQLFPEIAELRAIRFKELDRASQIRIAARLRKQRPRKHWPKKMVGVDMAEARLYSTVRELRRIEVAGGELPSRTEKWLKLQLPRFAVLTLMEIDTDFAKGATGHLVLPNPDSRFDSLHGDARLSTLETALATGRRSWPDGPAERANDWINQQGNAEKLLADLEAVENGGDQFPEVWNRFGWAHRPIQQEGDDASKEALSGSTKRVIGLLDQLTDPTLLSAIEGICAWLDAWDQQVVELPSVLAIWLRLWPIAVAVTNQTPENLDAEDLNVTARSTDDEREPMDLDTLNTPAGKLVGVFLRARPRLEEGVQAFSAASIERQMRDTVINAVGRSGLIAKHRMIEELPYFLKADHDWTQKHLIAPLEKEDGAAIALWRAVARRTHFTKVLEIIGGRMSELASDRRLGRETRRRLVFSLVIECLHAFRENREPAVPCERIQQMLRTVDDEVRASAANAIQIFVRDLSAKPPADQLSKTPEELFSSAALQFLSKVWPKERSLATPGVSRALADLPATSGEAFAEAVATIERFLVPFDCWSMINYGLYGDVGGTNKLAIIDDQAKAKALLKLLELTVGSSEGAVVPNGLTDALDQIKSVAPDLVESPAFRRLATAARR
jgi:hypothetical protein